MVLILLKFFMYICTQLVKGLWLLITTVYGIYNCPKKMLTLVFFLIILSFFLFLVQFCILPTFLSSLRPTGGFNNIKKKLIYNYLSTGRTFLIPLYISQIILAHYLYFFWSMGEVISFNIEQTLVLINGVEIQISLILDDISAGFLFTTVFIGVLVNSFLPIYMVKEPKERRFTILLNSFLFSMLFLIMSANLITFFLFWEMIGIFSYLLINFWVTKSATHKSGMKAFVYNQLSDVMLFLGIFQYYNYFSTFQFPEKNILATLLVEGGDITTLLVPFFIAASCKSVQFFFHFWLPDSMDAPVPASALIHSATLVAAGILLVARLKPLFVLDTHVTTFFSYLALLTIVVGGLSATNQSDLKKILAHSTISNCGYMMFLAINTNNTTMLVFFIAHGLLKAASFIFSGFIILIMKHRQDYRYAGDYGTLFKALFVGTLLSVITLGSAPLTIMSSLKHSIFTNSLSILTDSLSTNLALLLGSLASLIYSLKIINLVFCYSRNKVKLSEQQIKTVNEPEVDGCFIEKTCIFNGILLKIVSSITYILVTITILFYIYGTGFDMDTIIMCGTNTSQQYNGVMHVTNWDRNITRLFGLLQVVTIFCLTLPTWTGYNNTYVLKGAFLFWIILAISVVL